MIEAGLLAPRPAKIEPGPLTCAIDWNVKRSPSYKELDHRAPRRPDRPGHPRRARNHEAMPHRLDGRMTPLGLLMVEEPAVRATRADTLAKILLEILTGLPLIAHLRPGRGVPGPPGREGRGPSLAGGTYDLPLRLWRSPCLARAQQVEVPQRGAAVPVGSNSDDWCLSRSMTFLVIGICPSPR